jgi:hypothetical protein
VGLSNYVELVCKGIYLAMGKHSVSLQEIGEIERKCKLELNI